MKCSHLLAPLILLPLYAYSQGNNSFNTTKLNFPKIEAESNTLVKSYSNESEQLKTLNTADRTIDVPTQIVRIGGYIDGLQLSCDQVNKNIEQTLLNHISSDKFIFNTVIYCTYDPETHYAVHFNINSYFDPINDAAVSYLSSFLGEYNGSDLMGAKLEIESARGLVIALSLTAGVKKNPNKPPFTQYRQDRANFYFNNNYEMRYSLFKDISANFFTNESEKILPFLDKWLFAYASTIYPAILKDSNFVELQPERIFLMDHGDTIFVSNMKFYFAHDCTEHENRHCL
jgi:hypothetical protein